MRVQAIQSRQSSWSLKGRLLIGAAGMSLAAQPGTALAEQKWQPHLDAGGKIGDDRAIGQVDLFVPIWQDSDTLLFGNVRGRFDDDKSEEGNFGLGLRERINPEWILGVYGFYDVKSSTFDNTFNQFSAGIEFLSEDWDFRFNGYLAEDDLEIVPGLSQVVVQGNSIQIFNGVEGALSGFDIEAGYRVYKSDQIEGRVFIGGFYFDHDDLEEITGPRIRGEARIFDLDFLGPQSRLTVSAELSHDDVRDTTVFGGLSLRIPLSAVSGAQVAPFQGLDRRMVDPIQRDVDIVTTTSNTVPEFTEDLFIVLPNGKAGDFDTVVYFDKTGGGVGTYDDPADFAQATFDTAGVGVILVGLDATGDVAAPATGITLKDEQVVLGGGTTILAQGENTGVQVPFTFDGARPNLVGTAGAAHTFTLANYNVLENLDFSGTFASAIYGKDVTGFVINDIDVDGSAGGVSGFGFAATASGDFAGEINDFSVTKTTGDALAFYLYANDGLASTAAFALSDIAVDGVDGTTVDTGVFFDAYLTAGSTLDLTLDLTGVTLNNVVGYGINVDLFSLNVGSAITADIAISEFALTDTSGTLNDGLSVKFLADDLASTTGTVAIGDATLTGTGFAGSTSDGVYLLSGSYRGGTVSQVATLTNLSISGENFYEGMEIDTGAYGYGKSGGKLVASTAEQDVTITGMTIDGVDGEGLHLDGDAGTTGQGTQTVTVTDFAITNAGNQGIEVDADSYGATLYGVTVYRSLLTQTLALDTGAVTASVNEGIEIDSSAYFGGRVEQSTLLTDVTVEDNGTAGLAVISSADGAGLYGATLVQSEIYQTINAIGGSFSYNNVGADIAAFADDGGIVTQFGEFESTRISSNTTDGVQLDVASSDGKVLGGAFVESDVFQIVQFTYTFISDNGANGLYGAAVATDGGEANQFAVFNGSAIDANVGDGVQMKGDASGFTANGGSYYGSFVDIAAVGYLGADITGNGGDGIDIAVTATNEAGAEGTAAWFGETGDTGVIAGNSGNGINLYGTATKGGAVGLDVDLELAEVTGNTKNGVLVFGTADDTGAATKQNTFIGIGVDVADSSVSTNGLDGLSVYGFATSTVDDVIASVYSGLFNSTFDGNGAAGTDFFAGANGALADAYLTVVSNPSSFSGNGTDGFTVELLADDKAQVYGALTITDGTFSGNTDAGFYTDTNATDGGYAALVTVLNNATASDNGYFGVASYGVATGAFGGTDSAILTDLEINGGAFQNNGIVNIGAVAEANDGTTATVNLDVSDAIVTGSQYGIYFETRTDDPTLANPAAIYGQVTIDNTQVADNTVGAFLQAQGFDYSINQVGIDITSSTFGAFTGAATYAANALGIRIFATHTGAAGGFGTTVDADLDGVTADGNSANFDVLVYAGGGGQAGLYLDVANSSFNDATGGDGVNLLAGSSGVGSVAYLDTEFTNVTANGNSLSGFDLTVAAYNKGDVEAFIGLYDITATGNAGDGVSAQTNSQTGGQSYSELTVDGATLTGNSGAGIDVAGTADGAGSYTEFEFYLYNANADYNAVGIQVTSEATNGGLTDLVDAVIDDSSANKVTGGTGIIIENTASTGGTSKMGNFDISYTEANYNTVGMTISNTDVDGTGTASQNVYLYNVQTAHIDSKQFSTGMRFINQGVGATQDIDGKFVDVDPNTVGFFILNQGGFTQTGTITDAQYLDTLIPFAGGTFGIVITP